MKHRKALKTTIAAALACYAVALVAPVASAKPHDSKPGGKKAIATIVSFAPGADETTAGTLTYTEEGSTETMTVSVEPDAKIKVEHRGDHSTGKGHGNPSRGDFEDLTEGTKILKMKGDETLDKIRIRPAPAATTTACEDDSEETETETEAEDADESDESDDTDESDASEESDEDTEGSEDEDAPALMSKPDSTDDDCDDSDEAEAEDADEDGDEASDEGDTEESDEDDDDDDDQDDDDDDDDIVTEIVEDVLP